MITINLLPPELRKKDTPRLAIPNVFNRDFILMALGIFLALHGLLVALVIYQRLEFGVIKKGLTSLREETREISQLKDEIKSREARIREIQSLTDRKFSWARILNALTDTVPKGMWLRSLSVAEVIPASGPENKKVAAGQKEKSKELKLQGSVVSNGQETATIGRFIKALKEDPYFSLVFEEIEFSNITQRKIKSFDVYDFAILCAFKNGKS